MGMRTLIGPVARGILAWLPRCSTKNDAREALEADGIMHLNTPLSDPASESIG